MPGIPRWNKSINRQINSVKKHSSRQCLAFCGTPIHWKTTHSFSRSKWKYKIERIFFGFNSVPYMTCLWRDSTWELQYQVRGNSEPSGQALVLPNKCSHRRWVYPSSNWVCGAGKSKIMTKKSTVRKIHMLRGKVAQEPFPLFPQSTAVETMNDFLSVLSLCRETCDDILILFYFVHLLYHSKTGITFWVSSWFWDRSN